MHGTVQNVVSRILELDLPRNAVREARNQGRRASELMLVEETVVASADSTASTQRTAEWTSGQANIGVQDAHTRWNSVKLLLRLGLHSICTQLASSKSYRAEIHQRSNYSSAKFNRIAMFSPTASTGAPTNAPSGLHDAHGESSDLGQRTIVSRTGSF